MMMMILNLNSKDCNQSNFKKKKENKSTMRNMFTVTIYSHIVFVHRWRNLSLFSIELQSIYIIRYLKFFFFLIYKF